jgi:hypothetical protein
MGRRKKFSALRAWGGDAVRSMYSSGLGFDLWLKPVYELHARFIVRNPAAH